MFSVPLLIISSFVAVIISFAAMIINTFLEEKKDGLTNAHYWLGITAFILYAVAFITVLVDGRSWSKFKSEMLILLVIFVLTFIAGYFGKYKKQRLFHYLMVLILAIVVAIMHIKWSLPLI